MSRFPSSTPRCTARTRGRGCRRQTRFARSSRRSSPPRRPAHRSSSPFAPIGTRLAGRTSVWSAWSGRVSGPPVPPAATFCSWSRTATSIRACSTPARSARRTSCATAWKKHGDTRSTTRASTATTPGSTRTGPSSTCGRTWSRTSGATISGRATDDHAVSTIATRALDALTTGSRLIAARLRGRAVPFHVTLYVTTRCNLRCVYCSSPDQHEKELTAADWRGVLDQLRTLGTRRVLFFGGEPLVRADLGEIVAHARRLGLRCALTSNGTLVPQRPDVIRQLQTLTISLDGDAVAHDANRGRGSHADALRALAAARKWGVPVKVNAVLNANNGVAFEWLSEWSKKERIPLTLNLMRSERNGLWKDAARHRLEDDRLRELIWGRTRSRASGPTSPATG
ncbi:MAG: hypothetical protein DMD81_13585 [Candidatus Rokuibacteriota bacterium]|nr:MAG: hypothetical protein DMD81_13585 [Candidatus Rokubacteria bacterium]